MTFREKSTWACLVSTVVIYAAYFGAAFGLWGTVEPGSVGTVLLYVVAVIAQVVTLIVAHVVFAVRSVPESPDERDSAIQLRGLRSSSLVLSVGVLLCVLGILAHEVVIENGHGLSSLTPIALGHLLLLFFVVSEVANYGTQVFYYRRGF